MSPLEYALAYAARGWHVVPIPEGYKYPKGMPDWQARATTDEATIRQWWTCGQGIGIATGRPSGMFVLDVDPDHGGDDTLADLEHEHGRLPDTIEVLTGGGGRHLYFSMPDGTDIVNDQGSALGPGLDIRGTGGQAVAPPTIHPNGTKYEWEALSDPFDGATVSPAPTWLIELLAAPQAPREPRRTTRSATLASDRPGDRFEAETQWPDLLERDGWTLHSARQGRTGDYELWTRPGKTTRDGASASLHYGGSDVLKVFSSSVPNLDADATYSRFGYFAATRFGGDHAAAARHLAAEYKPEPTPPPNVDPDTGEIHQDWRNLPDEFWDSRECLAHVRQAAHSRYRCADSVLLATMARVATLIPPTVTLPAVVGSPASLNFFGAIVGRSGGGKSTAKNVACELVPIKRKDILADVSPGSGEGLVEMFLEWVDVDAGDKKRKEKRQTKTAAFVFVDEGQSLLAMSERSGTTIMPIMRSAWSGATLGQQNASQETNRRLGEHSYRMAMVLGFQLAYAASLIADAEGGTPQRFVFASATDPTVPDTPPQWPGPLPVHEPPTVWGGTTIDFDAEIVAGIRRRALGATRGEWEVDPLDTHADLGQMKVAAILAVMDGGRTLVTVDDWGLAAMIMRSSRAVRTWAIEEARIAAASSEASYARKLAERASVVEDTVERRALESGARSLARRVHRDPDETTKRREVLAAVGGKHKKLVSVDDMIAHAVNKGWVTVADGGFIPGDSRPS